MLNVAVARNTTALPLKRSVSRSGCGSAENIITSDSEGLSSSLACQRGSMWPSRVAVMKALTLGVIMAARSQDRPPAQANEIFVVAAQGGRVFVAYSKDLPPVGPIAACDAVRRDYEKKATEAVQNTTLNPQEQRRQVDDASEKSDTEFLRCFQERAARQAGFSATVQAAQALLDRLPLR